MLHFVEGVVKLYPRVVVDFIKMMCDDEKAWSYWMSEIADSASQTFSDDEIVLKIELWAYVCTNKQFSNLLLQCLSFASTSNPRSS